MSIVKVAKVYKKFNRNHHRSIKAGVKAVVLEYFNFKSSNDLLPNGDFWAVQNVSFELEEGESLGVVGTNGSGKTTLLKMISGIIRPDKGVIETKGKISPLFATGAGFDEILSGKENIHLNLSLLGLSNNEITNVYGAIVEFSELSDSVLESPVKTYSSGMKARLGFSCAIHTSPKLLIVDEALAVGDLRFRTKCYRKLNELKSKGTSLILVSHSSGTILANCDKALFLKNGEQVSYGKTEDVLTEYEHYLKELDAKNSVSSSKSISETHSSIHNTGIIIKNLELLNEKGQVVNSLTTSKTAQVRFRLKIEKSFDHLNIALLIKDISSNFDNLLDFRSRKDGFLVTGSPGEYEYYLTFPALHLAPGRFSIKLYVSDVNESNVLDAVESFRFNVSSDQNFISNLFYQPHHWNVTKREG